MAWGAAGGLVLLPKGGEESKKEKVKSQNNRAKIKVRTAGSNSKRMKHLIFFKNFYVFFQKRPVFWP
jgi:hypothetical protein